MNQHNFAEFTFNRYSFEIKTRQDSLLPANRSSMFRGGFGHIFKQLNCVNKSNPACKECQLSKTCAYSSVFETHDINDVARPYIFETLLNDKRDYKKDEFIEFDLVLMGKANQYLPHFIYILIKTIVSVI
jgi:hypothetical protein